MEGCGVAIDKVSMAPAEDGRAKLAAELRLWPICGIMTSGSSKFADEAVAFWSCGCLETVGDGRSKVKEPNCIDVARAAVLNEDGQLEPEEFSAPIQFRLAHASTANAKSFREGGYPYDVRRAYYIE